MQNRIEISKMYKTNKYSGTGPNGNENKENTRSTVKQAPIKRSGERLDVCFELQQFSRFCVAFEKKIFSCLRIIFWLNGNNPLPRLSYLRGTCAGVL